MSADIDKIKHSKRIHAKQTAVKRQAKIAKAYGIEEKEAHRFAKVHASNCGNSNCFQCGNPRKFFGEETIQERRFKQAVEWD